MINVMIDASILGEGFLSSCSRTGIHRVTVNLIQQLMQAGECQVTLCASISPDICQVTYAVARLEGYLAHAEFACAWPLHVSRNVRRILNRIPVSLASSKLGRNICRKLQGSVQWMESNVALIPAKTLSRMQIYHTPFQIFPDVTTQPAERGSLKRFLHVHDMIPIVRPEFHIQAVKTQFKASIDALKPCDWAFADSTSTKKDLLEYLPWMNPDQIIVMYNAASKLFYPCRDEVRLQEVRGKYGIPEGPYVISVATLDARKNLVLVVDAFIRLLEQEKIPDLNLVLVGTKGGKVDEFLARIHNLGKYSGRIILTGYVDDADLAPLYSGALAFTYMSHYEGFGLPPLEAMQCGIPVITSNSSSLPEVVGSAGIMLDSRDAEGVCEALFHLYRDSDFRTLLARRSLQQASHFSWERFRVETLAAYRLAIYG